MYQFGLHCSKCSCPVVECRSDVPKVVGSNHSWCLLLLLFQDSSFIKLWPVLHIYYFNGHKTSITDMYTIYIDLNSYEHTVLHCKLVPRSQKQEDGQKSIANSTIQNSYLLNARCNAEYKEGRICQVTCRCPSSSRGR